VETTMKQLSLKKREIMTKAFA